MELTALSLEHGAAHFFLASLRASLNAWLAVIAALTGGRGVSTRARRFFFDWSQQRIAARHFVAVEEVVPTREVAGAVRCGVMRCGAVPYCAVLCGAVRRVRERVRVTVGVGVRARVGVRVRVGARVTVRMRRERERVRVRVRVSESNK